VTDTTRWGADGAPHFVVATSPPPRMLARRATTRIRIAYDAARRLPLPTDQTRGRRLGRRIAEPPAEVP